MRLAILIILAALGLMIPLFWLIGTVGRIPLLWRHLVGVAREEPSVVLNPELGITMADGGDVIDKEKKE